MEKMQPCLKKDRIGGREYKVGGGGIRHFTALEGITLLWRREDKKKRGVGFANKYSPTLFCLVCEPLGHRNQILLTPPGGNEQI